MSPTVSVLMPVYNCARYVAEAADSILRQTFGGFEFIIIDDGSTDGSLAVLRRYAAQDSRVRLVSRPNTGIVGALNEGLSLARAEFVARMDADDISLPERLATQLAYLQENPTCVAVGCWLLFVDPEGSPLWEWRNEIDHDDIVDAQLTKNRPGITHASTVFRREAVMSVGAYRLQYETAEDLDLFLRLAERGRLANIPRVLYWYRQHPGSIGHSRRAQQRRATLEVLRYARLRRALVAREESPPSCDTEVLTWADQHRIWAWWALRSGYVRTARKHAWRAVLRSPLSSSCWRALACAVRGH